MDQSAKQVGLKDLVADKIAEIVRTISGFDVHSFAADESFFGMGMDSLLLTQVAVKLSSYFQTKVSYRDLLDGYPNIGQLAEHLATSAVAKGMLPVVTASSANAAQAPDPAARQVGPQAPAQAPALAIDQVNAVMQQHMQIMQTYMAFVQSQTPITRAEVPAPAKMEPLRSAGKPQAPGSSANQPQAGLNSCRVPPVASARLGRGVDGKPAWFIPDPKNPTRFVPVPEINGH